jgi:hypothetical protein
MILNFWFILGFVITIYILFIKDKPENVNGKATRQRVKAAFQNDALFYAIMAPSYVFWVLTFSVTWPLLVWVEYFYKKK